LHANLTEQEFDISLYMVRSIFDEHGIKCRRYKRFKVTTDSNHNKLIYSNLLDQKFGTSRPNESWVSDIAYIWTSEGWLYLTGIKELYTKELICYATNKRPSQALIVHSDRGSQYCSYEYHKIIKQYRFTG